LFFSAPLLGLALTFAVDRTANRTVFVYACLSTLCLCPLVYGVPTEMWMAHALFWPGLALCLSAPLTGRGTAAMCLSMLALVFTHEGAIVLSVAMMAALLLRGWRDARFRRALPALGAALVIWTAVKLTMQPDEYIAGVLHAAAFRFIDVRNLLHPALLSLLAALALYGVLVALLRRVGIPNAYPFAAAACVAALAVYWLFFDDALLAAQRYDLRTALLIMVPVFGLLVSVQTMSEAERRASSLPFLAPWATAIESRINAHALIGALLLVVLVHMVETSKFVATWTNYKTALRALASGEASDPQLGSPLFVSSRRIGAEITRPAWNSTTPYLSVLVSPGLSPSRLVVNPSANYFWLSCETARRSEAKTTAIPGAARQLVRMHACLHRP
jgi:hypothetical protein